MMRATEFGFLLATLYDLALRRCVARSPLFFTSARVKERKRRRVREDHLPKCHGGGVESALTQDDARERKTFFLGAATGLLLFSSLLFLYSVVSMYTHIMYE